MVISERRLRQAAEVWGLLLDAQDGARWLVVWRETPFVIEIGYVGSAPGIREIADQHRADGYGS